VVVSLPSIFASLEAGRAGARGPIRYPVIMGLLYQLLGISVVFPMVWVPSFVFGEGRRGSPLTSFRVFVTGLLAVPSFLLTAIVFVAPTDSSLWTTSAGMLGGPILALSGLVLFRDASSELSATEQNAKICFDASQRVLKCFMAVGFVAWYILVAIAYRAYGTSFGNLWNDIWVNADASVAFMTIDTGILYVAVLMYIAYRSDELKAAKAFLLTFVLGPGTACSFVLLEIAKETELPALSSQDAKKEE